MRLIRSLPRGVTRPLSWLVIGSWIVSMAFLVSRSYLQASPTLATDLGRYGSTALWRGVYYRGEKIGFVVSQTTRTDDGFELREDGRLQMLLLGQDTAATLRTTARVDTRFALQSFDFSLDPGTGPTEVHGVVEPGADPEAPGRRLRLTVTAAGSTRTEVRDLPEAPLLALNLARVLASEGLVPGTRKRWLILDPATLQHAPVEVHVRERTIVRTGDVRQPAFMVDLSFQGLSTRAWMTDTGDIVREESPLGLLTVRETEQRARGLAVPAEIRGDMLRSAAVVPLMARPIDEPRDVRRLRLRLGGAELPEGALDGVGQTVSGDEIEILDPRLLQPGPADPAAPQYLSPELFIESDAPEIRAEAALAVRDATTDRDRAERLTRYVNALLEKKPTVSLPSAREVLRTKVGDCNEHTALYVAMARASGLPAQIAVGLVFMRGAFFYHAWPEVYLREPDGRGLWLPVDPTLNQFPADGTHLRLARGGLEKQAVILPLIGRLQIRVLDLELAPASARILVGRTEPATDAAPATPPLPIALPRADPYVCGCSED